jgi:hypothetical protein
MQSNMSLCDGSLGYSMRRLMVSGYQHESSCMAVTDTALVNLLASMLIPLSGHTNECAMGCFALYLNRSANSFCTLATISIVRNNLHALFRTQNCDMISR